MSALVILLGVILIVFRRQVAEKIIQSQNSLWGFHFGEQEIKSSEIVVVIVGIGAIIFAILEFLKK
jgi:hypothetical protein